jgi:hypothetical protein
MNCSVIKRIQAKVVRLPSATPVAIATRVVTEQVFELLLTPILLGQDAADTDTLWTLMIKACKFLAPIYTAFDFDAIDIPQVDATVCGGITAFLAETHWFPELHVRYFPKPKESST